MTSLLEPVQKSLRNQAPRLCPHTAAEGCHHEERRCRSTCRIAGSHSAAYIFLIGSLLAGTEPQTQGLAAQTTVNEQPTLQQDQRKRAGSARDNSQNEATRTAIAVKPRAPVIKNKDLYEKSGYIHPFSRMPGYVLRDQKAIWTAPFHTSKRNAKYWVIFGAATGALIATDKWSVKELPNTAGQKRLGTYASRIGAAYSLIPITGAFYFIGSAARSDRFRETGLMSFEALVDATVVETVIKATTQRDRPLEGDGTGAFWSGKTNFWNAGFPSGHVINTWALASLWAHQYKHTIVVPVIAYGLGAAVMGARLAARRHFPGDVLPSAALGWFIGDYVFAKRHNSELDPKKSALETVLAHVRIGGSFN